MSQYRPVIRPQGGEGGDHCRPKRKVYRRAFNRVREHRCVCWSTNHSQSDGVFWPSANKVYNEEGANKRMRCQEDNFQEEEVMLRV